MDTNAKVISVNISKEKGVVKDPVDKIELKINHGIVGDAHAGDWHRQVSLLAIESYEKMRAKGLELENGAFAENITTEGIVLYELPIGTKLKIGTSVLEVTQIGKKCHKGCAIEVQTGDCVMPKEGIFCKVIEEGKIIVGDEITHSPSKFMGVSND